MKDRQLLRLLVKIPLEDVDGAVQCDYCGNGVRWDEYSNRWDNGAEIHKYIVEHPIIHEDDCLFLFCQEWLKANPDE